MTLGGLIDLWMKEKYRYAPERTKQRLMELTDKYIPEEYRLIHVKRIDDDFAGLFMSRLIDTPMRSADRYAVMDVMRDPCGFAVRKKYILYDPFLELRLPARKKVRHHALGEDDIRNIMSLDTHVTENAFFQIKLLTGTRTAECLGLCWSHVDFAAGTIRICDQLQYIAGNGKRKLGLSGHLKNFRPRVIHPPDLTFELLQIRKSEQEQEKQKWIDDPDHDYIFTNEKGGPISPSTISAAFREIVPHVHEKGMRLHDLRITNATITYRLTKDLKRAQKDLGHASPDVTMKYYIEPDPSKDKDVAEAIDRYYDFLS